MVRLVWIVGVCSYEVSGVEELLKRVAIPVRSFRPGNRLSSGDVMVLCFSQAPLMGWWKYLKLTGWLSQRYDFRLIVLCPEVVYRSGVVKGRNIVAVNGERAVSLLAEDLMHALQHNMSRRFSSYHSNMSQDFWGQSVCCLQTTPSEEITLQQLRKWYRRRSLLLQHTGFETLLCLKIFMTGYRQQ